MTASLPSGEDVYSILAPADASAFEDLFELYRSSMPAAERKSRATLLAFLGRNDYQVVLLHRAERLIGYSITFVPENDNFCLLEYMAVREGFRGGGIGAELFRHSVDTARAGRRDVAVLLEVDSYREASPDRAMRVRRQAFYQRLGCLRVEGLDYLLPLDTGRTPPVMDLMILPPADGRVIRRAELERWLRTVYVAVYDQSPSDPRIARMVSTVDDPLQLSGVIPR